MPETTDQMRTWMGDFGREYTDRNPQGVEETEDYCCRTYGLARTEMNERFVGALDRSLRVLEVGCNVGNQLACLQRMGFTDLVGIELQADAVARGRERTEGIDLRQGSAFEIPFEAGAFDLVFTSGVLIHINPADLPRALDEVHRVTRRYVWGFEYYAPEVTAIEYRGRRDLLWKADYAGEYLKRFADLALVRGEMFPYRDEPDKRDAMFLLEKKENP